MTAHAVAALPCTERPGEVLAAFLHQLVGELIEKNPWSLQLDQDDYRRHEARVSRLRVTRDELDAAVSALAAAGAPAPDLPALVEVDGHCAELVIDWVAGDDFRTTMLTPLAHELLVSELGREPAVPFVQKRMTAWNQAILSGEILGRLVKDNLSATLDQYLFEVLLDPEDYRRHRRRVTRIRVTGEDVDAARRGGPVVLPVTPDGSPRSVLPDLGLDPHEAVEFVVEWKPSGRRRVARLGHADFAVLCWELRQAPAVPFEIAVLSQPDPAELAGTLEIGSWYEQLSAGRVS